MVWKKEVHYSCENLTKIQKSYYDLLGYINYFHYKNNNIIAVFYVFLRIQNNIILVISQ